jgi:hypothetical protein
LASKKNLFIGLWQLGAIVIGVLALLSDELEYDEVLAVAESYTGMDEL